MAQEHTFYTIYSECSTMAEPNFADKTIWTGDNLDTWLRFDCRR